MVLCKESSQEQIQSIDEVCRPMTLNSGVTVVFIPCQELGLHCTVLFCSDFPKSCQDDDTNTAVVSSLRRFTSARTDGCRRRAHLAADLG